MPVPPSLNVLMMIVTFWLFISLTIYCYFGYPLLLWLVARFRQNPINKNVYEPTVSIVLSVWNEEDVIEAKLWNLLSLNYPEDKMEILIGSDGSNDLTNQIMRQNTDPRIHIIEQPRRLGKMVMLNALVKIAKNEIIIFCDARQRFASNAIKELVANFFDPNIGCVSGELIFETKPREGGTARGVNFYWNYEKLIRKHESQIHSMLGATGAIYAIRKKLFKEIPSQIVLDDMYVPLQIIRQGFRAVFDESAKAYDRAADSPREENRRKTRTIFGNYQIFGLFPHLFNPCKSPVAIQFFSHKLLRVLAPFLLILIFILNIFMIANPFYAGLLSYQILFYAMAITGGLSRNQKYGILRFLLKICYIPYVFCLLNFSALMGFIQFLRGTQDVQWKKARDLSSAQE